MNKIENQTYKFIIIERKGKVAIIKFNRPVKKNALSEVMRSEILDALALLKEEKRIKTIIFYGGEDFFSAGFDRDEVQAVIQGEGDYQSFVDSNHLFHQTIFEYPKLMIAAVNGYALAGAFDLAVLIIGGGNVGLCFLKALLIEKYPNYIAIVEPHEFLRNKAIEIGASHAVAPSRAKIRKITKKFGDPTFVFDCVGNEETISNSVNYIKRGGTILLEGIHKGSITFPIFMTNSKEVTLKGCLGHDREDILAAIDLFAKNKIDASTFISDVISLKNIQKTFERFLEPVGNRNFIKILVEI